MRVVHRLTTIVFVLLSLGACTHFTHERLAYATPSPWADQIRAAAVEAYPYAQMAYDAYGTGDRFDLGPDYRNTLNQSGRFGFAYSIFQRRSGSVLSEVILASVALSRRVQQIGFSATLLARRINSALPFSTTFARGTRRTFE
jgi:hypothetical protein